MAFGLKVSHEMEGKWQHSPSWVNKIIHWFVREKKKKKNEKKEVNE